MSTVTEWLAVCGGGGGGPDPRIVAEQQAVLEANRQASLARLRGEQQEILTLVRSIQQSGKAGIELGKVLAELYTQAATDYGVFHPTSMRLSGAAWLGKVSAASGATTYRGRIYSVVAQTADGSLHVVEATEYLCAIAFARGIATLCSSPSVVSVDVRLLDRGEIVGTPDQISDPMEIKKPKKYWSSDNIARVWGGVLVGKRYATLYEMAGTLSGQLIQQVPGALPETLTAPDMGLLRPSAQPPLESSVQGVSASKILPWVLGAAGVAVVVMLVARQRRKE